MMELTFNDGSALVSNIGLLDTVGWLREES